MRHLLRRAIGCGLVGVTGVAVSYLLAVAYVAGNSWFGAGDLQGFLFWTVPFGIVLCFTAAALDVDLRTWRRGTALLVSLAVGLVLATIWAFAVRAVLGSWYYAFSFPVPYFWMAGSATGLAAARFFPIGATAVANGRSAVPTSARRRWLFRGILVYVIGLPALSAVLAAGTLIGAVALSWATDRAEPELHLIPEGYMGNVYIIHGVRGAAAPEYEDGRRLYRIGPDGVHLSRLAGNPGWQDVRYYYVSEVGTRVEISGRWSTSIHDTEENRADATTLGIFFPRTGTFSKGASSCEIHYDQYFVGTKAFLLNAKPEEFLRRYLESNPDLCLTQNGT